MGKDSGVLWHIYLRAIKLFVTLVATVGSVFCMNLKLMHSEIEIKSCLKVEILGFDFDSYFKVDS
jgi:hypothetical protein